MMSKEAKKLALEALKQERENYRLYGDEDGAPEYIHEAIKTLEEALAKQEQGGCEYAGNGTAGIQNETKPTGYFFEMQKQEQGEPVAWLDPWTKNNVTTDYDAYGEHGIPLYTTPQQRKPLMLEKFKEMEALLDDSNVPQHKTITDDELKIIMETTMPVIDWKARHGVELNNGERNKWMLEWFITFARAIEAAHGIKENT